MDILIQTILDKNNPEHLKYEDIDSLFPHVLKILTPPFPHSMLHMIWVNANSLPQHCVGGGKGV